MNELIQSKRCCGSSSCHSHGTTAAEGRTAQSIALHSVPFHFAVPGDPCSYWKSTGNHIVVNGKCRCGRRFVVSEQPADLAAA